MCFIDLHGWETMTSGKELRHKAKAQVLLQDRVNKELRMSFDWLYTNHSTGIINVNIHGMHVVFISIYYYLFVCLFIYLITYLFIYRSID
jgi:hypothetical protein